MARQRWNRRTEGILFYIEWERVREDLLFNVSAADHPRSLGEVVRQIGI